MQAVFWFLDDWIGSTKRRQMDFAEQSGYFLLLCHAAKSDDGSLPVDDYGLASLSELGPLWTEKPGMSPITRGERIRACFFERDGRLFNARLLREFERRAERSEVARTNANKRWDAKRAQNECGDDANANANMDAKKCSLDLRSQTLDPRARNKEKTSCASDEARDANGDSFLLSEGKPQARPDPREAWFETFWSEYRPIRSRARKDARKAFMASIKNEAILAEVMAGLRAQAQELLSRDPEKRPYAASWLRGERWRDEVAEVESTRRTEPTSPTERAVETAFEE